MQGTFEDHGIGGVPEENLAWPGHYGAPVVDDHDVVTQSFCFVQVMRAQQYGGALGTESIEDLPRHPS